MVVHDVTKYYSSFLRFPLEPCCSDIEKSRQCLEPRPVDIVCVAVVRTMSVGGVLCVIAVAVAVVILSFLFPTITLMLLFSGVSASRLLASRLDASAMVGNYVEFSERQCLWRCK